MNNGKDIEARLEKSLRAQVKAPRLEKRFDAAVWARIDAGKVAERQAVPASTNWLFVLNGIGVGVAFVLLCVFGLQSLSGLGTSVVLPEISVAPSTAQLFAKFAPQAIALVTVVFGLMFTPLGRRLRAEFS